MRRLQVYLGHMTYRTAGAESQAYPLNIGFLKSYALKKLNENVDIKLFIDVDMLCDAIKSHPPDILGLSNYTWCSSLSENIFRYAKNINKEMVAIAGGPNYPLSVKNKEIFWRDKAKFIDFYVVEEGEETFLEFLQFYLGETNFKKGDIEIGGLDYWDSGRNLVSSAASRERIKDVEELIPSPILNGYLDQFIKLTPMLQGVRGCPYSCQFCHMSSTYYNKVYQFSYDRLIEEIEYIRKRGNPCNYIMFTDDNFGMFKKDIKLIEYLKKSYVDTGWPIWIYTAPPKRMNKSFIEASINSSGLIRAGIHLQSINEGTLKFIKRRMPSRNELKLFNSNFDETISNKMSNTSLVIPMPCETFETYMDAMKLIIDDYRVEQCNVWTLQVFLGNVFENKKILSNFNMKLKYRLEAGYFGEFKRFSSFEIDTVCVSTNTFSEDEYYKARLFYFVCTIFYFKRNFFYLRMYIKGKNISIFEWIYYLYENIYSSKNEAVKDYFLAIDDMSRKELFNTPAEIEAFWNVPGNREKCLKGEFGFNLIQMCLANIRFVYDEVLNYVLESTKTYFDSKEIKFGKEIDEIIKVMRYQRLNNLNENEIARNVIDTHDYDFVAWKKDGFINQLSDYYKSNKISLSISFSEKQKQDLKELIKTYPANDPVSVSKFYYRINPNLFYRSIGYTKTHYASSGI